MTKGNVAKHSLQLEDLILFRVMAKIFTWSGGIESLAGDFRNRLKEE